MEKITKIEPQRRTKGRSNIFINEEFVLGASDYAIRKQGIQEGMEITREQIEAIVYEDELEKAKGYIVNYHLNKSEKTIRQKLKEKEYTERVIEATLDFLERYRLIDDAEYARKLAHDAFRIKRQGSSRIKQTLKQKGVGEEEIEQALNQFTEEEEVDTAIRVLAPKFEVYRTKSKNPYDHKNRCYQLLLRKGFSGSVISKTLETFDFH